MANMETPDTEIRRLLRVPANEAICNYIVREGPSAHSDVAEELYRATLALPEHQQYCPNPYRYLYVIRYTNSDLIFAAAFGMSALVVRLPDAVVAEAHADGGKSFADLPREWVGFNPFRTDLSLTANRRKMREWCGASFRNAESYVDVHRRAKDI